MVKLYTKQSIAKTYRVWSRQKYSSYKHRYPKIRQSQLVNKIIKQWESLSPEAIGLFYQMSLEQKKFDQLDSDSEPSIETFKPVEDKKVQVSTVKGPCLPDSVPKPDNKAIKQYVMVEIVPSDDGKKKATSDFASRKQKELPQVLIDVEGSSEIDNRLYKMNRNDKRNLAFNLLKMRKVKHFYRIRIPIKISLGLTPEQANIQCSVDYNVLLKSKYCPQQSALSMGFADSVRGGLCAHCQHQFFTVCQQTEGLQLQLNAQQIHTHLKASHIQLYWFYWLCQYFERRSYIIQTKNGQIIKINLDINGATSNYAKLLLNDKELVLMTLSANFEFNQFQKKKIPPILPVGKIKQKIHKLLSKNELIEQYSSNCKNCNSCKTFIIKTEIEIGIQVECYKRLDQCKCKWGFITEQEFILDKQAFFSAIPYIYKSLKENQFCQNQLREWNRFSGKHTIVKAGMCHQQQEQIRWFLSEKGQFPYGTPLNLIEIPSECYVLCLRYTQILDFCEQVTELIEGAYDSLSQGGRISTPSKEEIKSIFNRIYNYAIDQKKKCQIYHDQKCRSYEDQLLQKFAKILEWPHHFGSMLALDSNVDDWVKKSMFNGQNQSDLFIERLLTYIKKIQKKVNPDEKMIKQDTKIIIKPEEPEKTQKITQKVCQIIKRSRKK